MRSAILVGVLALVSGGQVSTNALDYRNPVRLDVRE
jgi:hypothetical protein